MADRVLELLGESLLSLNYIPSGRQLPRTPPLVSVKKELDFCSEDSNECEELQQSEAVHTDGSDQDDDNQNATFDFNTFGIKSEPDDPNAMLKGMKGYQLTQTDLEFIEKLKAEKLIKKLQGDLQELQRLLMKETKLSKLALVSREKARAGLQKFPSCEDVAEWVKVVLKMTSPSTEVTELDAKALVALVTRKNIRRATDERRTELSRMEKMVANKRKKEAQAKGQLEKQVALEQLKMQGLMSQLSDLKSELSQQEEVYKALEMQINVQEAPEVPAGDVDASEERQATRRGKGRAKAPNAIEKLQDATNQRRPTKSKLRDGPLGVKDDQEKTLKTRQKCGAADPKEKKARGPRQESVRGKAPGPTDPKRKNQSPANAEGAPSCPQQAAPLQGRRRAAGEEAPHPVLRRSKRIASRT